MSSTTAEGPDGLPQVRALLVTGRQPPLGEKLGISLIEADHGHAAFEATPDGSSYNPMGSVDGGYIATLLDSACGIAAHTALKAGYGYTTLELKVSFVKGLSSSGTIRATGRHDFHGAARRLYRGHAAQRQGAGLCDGDLDVVGVRAAIRKISSSRRACV
jgi:uncharacterized protein (TIGR00369 family)